MPPTSQVVVGALKMLRLRYDALGAF